MRCARPADCAKAALITVAVAPSLLPRPRRQSEIGLDHARACRELRGRSLQHELAHFQHIAVIGDLQSGAGILLDQQDRDSGRSELGNHVKDVAYDLRRKAEAWL